MASAIFGWSAALWRATRAEYETYRESAYDRAVDACNGVLLNARGKAARIDAYSLFMGPEARAVAYASTELQDHWKEYPRMTYQAFERQTFEGQAS